MKLLFDYPWYCLFLCLLLGAAYSALLYWRRRPADGESLPRGLNVALPLLRFLSVSLIAFLLMAPLVRRNVSTREKPIVVVALDHSESVQQSGPMLSADHFKALRSHYDVVVDTFGGKATDIAAELSAIGDRYVGRNLGAIVLASDGIYNQGQNPSLAASASPVPIYTVALGDTTLRRDAAIAHVRFNRVAYLGSQFPLEVTVRASRLKGARASLSVARGGQKLSGCDITYSDDPFTTTQTLLLNADKPGLQTYTLSLSPSPDEVTTANNRLTIAVEVLDSRQKIAILAAAPHPDLAALRQAIQLNPNYEVSVQTLATGIHTDQLADCSLLVLHNLPNSAASLNLTPLRHLPTIYIIGSQTDLGRFNALRTGFDIIAKTRKTDEVTASFNQAFALFTLPDDVGRRFEQMPPLSAPFGTYRTAGNIQTLFAAKIGSVVSDRPLIAFGQQEGVRRAFVVGEGLWQWRLHDYLMTGSHDHFNQLIEKMVVYTSLQTNQDPFRVIHDHIYQEGQPIVIQAELYNDNFEPVNTPPAKFTLTPASAAQGSAAASTFEFNRSGSGYTLSLGTLQPGLYNYTASTSFLGHSHRAAGSFIVEQLNLEQLNLQADHTLLNTIAQSTGAQMLYPSQLDQLPQLLAQRSDLKTVLYSHSRYTDLLNLPWLLVLIVLLLGVEWAVRKYFFG